jgi:hypothetical protein
MPNVTNSYGIYNINNDHYLVSLDKHIDMLAPLLITLN